MRRGQEAVRAVVEAERASGRTAAGRACPGGTRGRPRRDGLDAAPAERRSRRPGCGRRRIGHDPSGERRPARRRRSRRAGARSGGSWPRRASPARPSTAVSRWANGLRSLPTPIRPSAQAWSGRRAAAGERIEDDVAGPRVAGDERVGRGPPGSSRGTSTSGGTCGPTAAAGPSTRARWRSPAARAGGRGRAGSAGVAIAALCVVASFGASSRARRRGVIGPLTARRTWACPILPDPAPITGRRDGPRSIARPILATAWRWTGSSARSATGL